MKKFTKYITPAMFLLTVFHYIAAGIFRWSSFFPFLSLMVTIVIWSIFEGPKNKVKAGDVNHQKSNSNIASVGLLLIGLGAAFFLIALFVSDDPTAGLGAVVGPIVFIFSIIFFLTGGLVYFVSKTKKK